MPSPIRAIRLLVVLLLAAAHAALLPAQTLSSVSTRWGDSFVEWDIYAFDLSDTSEEEAGSDEDAADESDERVIGGMQLRWLNVRDDWSEWDFELGEQRGTIKMKWKDDPTHWELRTYDGDVVTMRAAWANDPSQWRITNNSNTLTLRSRWTNQIDEWYVDDRTYGRLGIHTFRRGDPRDWAVEDELTDDISPAMKLAMVFVVIFHSVPKQ